MSKEVTLTVQRRETRGKNSNRRLRKEQVVPAVVYGAGRDTVAIQVSAPTVERMLREGGENRIFKLQLEGADQSRHAMIRDLQTDATTDRLIHIDFLRVMMDEKIRVKIPIETDGVPTGVKNDGGVMDFVTREVEVECLPGDIPDSLVIDVSELHIGQHIEASELDLPSGVELLEEEDRVLVSISAPRQEEEIEEEEGEEWIEGEQEEPELVGDSDDDEKEGDE